MELNFDRKEKQLPTAVTTDLCITEKTSIFNTKPIATPRR